MSVSVTARFTVTVDVPLGSWNEAETFDKLRETAKREGIPKLRRNLTDVDYRIIGEPKLTTIMAVEK
jgi:hypothetical protein